MSKLTEALDDSECELVVEAMSRFRQVKVKAWREAQQHPVTQSLTRADFGIEQIDAVLRKLDITIKEDSVPDEFAPKPRVAIRMEGGVIQSMFANQDVQIDVINYDVEDAAPPEGYEDQDHRVCELEQDDGSYEECVISRGSAEVLPEWFPKIDRALATELEETVGLRP